MLRADQLSTLNDCAAIQVDAADGLFGRIPAAAAGLGGREFTWTDRTDRTRPVACVTIDRYDLSTRSASGPVMRS